MDGARANGQSSGISMKMDCWCHVMLCTDSQVAAQPCGRAAQQGFQHGQGRLPTGSADFGRGECRAGGSMCACMQWQMKRSLMVSLSTEGSTPVVSTNQVC